MEEPAETLKVLAICKSLNSTPAKITPKRFFEIFLASNNSEICVLASSLGSTNGLGFHHAFTAPHPQRSAQDSRRERCMGCFYSTRSE
ncbi:hypothetical protein PSTT_05396 [Puccinia striiformis]|uniref:Uncharacterized protein n=1 Tax=Puccinia striiformis TaxID=27350 RepID=A0A2S4VPA6_9BASI|nr:hypothetical protein PSTT_05396 [Puccinia striiformis]